MIIELKLVEPNRVQGRTRFSTYQVEREDDTLYITAPGLDLERDPTDFPSNAPLIAIAAFWICELESAIWGNT